MQGETAFGVGQRQSVATKLDLQIRFFLEGSYGLLPVTVGQ
jgi:hypothetical protein